MKKIRLAAFFLAITMLLSLAAAAVGSQGFVWRLSADKTNVSAGESVELTVYLTPSQDYYEFNSAEIYVTWDPSLFEVTQVKGQNLFKATALSSDETVKDHIFINRYTNSTTSMISWNTEKPAAVFSLKALRDGSCTLALSKPQLTQTVQYQPQTIPAAAASPLTLTVGNGGTAQPGGGYNPTIQDNPIEKKPEENAPQVTKITTFADVPTTHWANEAVRFCCELGLFTGTSATTFSPESAVTRGMFMTVLARCAGADTDGGSVWYEKGQQWAMENEISDGTHPELPLTREQLVTMLYRFCGNPVTDGTVESFPDAADASDFSRDALGWAIKYGILNGINGRLSPKSGATRAQLAAILMRWSFLEY